MKHLKNIAIFFVALAGFAISSQAFGETMVSSERQKMIDYGLTLQGIHYKYGGRQPESGFDCSGFVGYVAKESLGINIYNQAAKMYENLEHIDEDQREPGDLIFFAVKSGSTYKVSHVGIYLGYYSGEGKLNGERIFLHSASDGPHTGVIVSSINERYWREHFFGYARFLAPTEIPQEESAVEPDAPTEQISMAENTNQEAQTTDLVQQQTLIAQTEEPKTDEEDE